MELGWLEDFLELAEAGNFSRAAETRHVTQPAFSRRIRALEEWVGTALFDRSTHHVTLTPAGAQLRPLVVEALRCLYQGRDAAREAGGAEATTLRFASTHVLSFTFFPGWLRGLESEQGLGTIRLISDSMQACEQIMAQGQAQFLLCHCHPLAPPKLDPARFRSTTLGHDRLVLAAEPGLAAAAAGGAPLATLPFLAYSLVSGLGRILAAAGAGRITPGAQPVLTSPLAAVLCRMATDGRGIAWLPESLITAELERGALKLLRPEAAVAVRIELFRPRARQSRSAEAFWSHITGTAAADHG